MKGRFKKILKRVRIFCKGHKGLMIFCFFMFLIGLLGLDEVIQEQKQPPKVSYEQFMQDVENGLVDTVYYDAGEDYMRYTLYNEFTIGKTEDELEDIKYEYPDEDWRMTIYPSGENFRKTLLEAGVKVNVKSFESGLYIIISTIFSIAVLIVPIIIVFKVMFSSSSDENEESVISNTKFSDVIGLDEILTDLKFIVSLVRKRGEMKLNDATIPKGVLLCGPPGTGKTLIAKAIAGEADVPFLAVNSSSLIEMFAGMGAKRVRDLFKRARKLAPCIVFIDEIDAIGCKRDKGDFQNTESRQTINALLQELDGFDTKSGVFVIAATNTPDSLDEALVRSGRFDRKIQINPPRDWKERKKLFEHFLEGCEVNIDLEVIAKQCTGFTGADINAIVNEAKLIAQINEASIITTAHVEEAIDKKIFNGNRSKKERHSKETKLVAYHEAGHAVMTFLQGKPIARATIASTTSGVGGFVMQNDEEKQFTSKTDLEKQLLICYAGRCSERIKFNEVSTGAVNDITQASKIIKPYVERYGFNTELGMLDTSVIISGYTGTPDFIVKIESDMARKFEDDAYALLMGNFHLVEKLAEELLARETLSGEAIEELLTE